MAGDGWAISCYGQIQVSNPRSSYLTALATVLRQTGGGEKYQMGVGFLTALPNGSVAEQKAFEVY